MPQNRSRDNAQIASERMAILFSEAERAAREGETGLSERYISLTRSIGMLSLLAVAWMMRMLA